MEKDKLISNLMSGVEQDKKNGTLPAKISGLKKLLNNEEYLQKHNINKEILQGFIEKLEEY